MSTAGSAAPLDPPSHRQQVWLGTAFGVEVWTPPTDDSSAADDSSGSPGGWSYLAGPRWLTAGGVRSIAVLPQPLTQPTGRAGANRGGSAGPAACGDTVVVVTDAGVTFLEQQCWTLAAKAALFEEILVARHGPEPSRVESDYASAPPSSFGRHGFSLNSMI